MKTLAVFVCVVFVAAFVQHAQGFDEDDLHSHLSSEDGEDELDGSDLSDDYSSKRGHGRKRHSRRHSKHGYGHSSYGYGPGYGHGGYGHHGKHGRYGYGGYGLGGYGGGYGHGYGGYGGGYGHGYGGYGGGYGHGYGGYGGGYGHGYGGYGGHGKYGGYGHGYGGYGYGGYGHHGKSLHHYKSPYALKTKYAIDSYLAKTHLLGDRRLQVNFKYLNTPLEVQYLNQYHGVQHPLSNTRLAPLFGLPYAPKYPTPYGHLWGGQATTYAQQPAPAAQPAYSAAPAQPVYAAQPAQPAYTGQPAQPAQLTTPAAPVQTQPQPDVQYQPTQQQVYATPFYLEPQQFSQPQTYPQAR